MALCSQVKIHMKVHSREDSSGGLGGASAYGRSGTPETRGAIAALYPELASQYGPESYTNDRSGRHHRANPDLDSSPPQASSQPGSDTEFSSEAAEKGDYESLPKDPPPLRVPPSSSSFPPPTSGTNASPTTHATNHSGGRSSPPPLEPSLSAEDVCGLSALKGTPTGSSSSSSYHIATNLKK